MLNDEYWIRLNIRKIWFRINDEKIQKLQKIAKRNLIGWSLSWSLDYNNWYRKHSHHLTWFKEQKWIWIDLRIWKFQQRLHSYQEKYKQKRKKK